MIKNVVIVNDFNYIQGGASKVAIDTANELKKEYKNLNVYFFCSVYKKENEINDEIMEFSSFQNENLKEKNKLKGAINGIYNFKSKKELDSLLEKLDPNETIVHVHGWTKGLSSSIFKSIQKNKFKYVITLHDYFSVCPNGGLFNYKKNVICNKKSMSMKCLFCNCDSRNYLIKLYRYVRQLFQNRIIFNKNNKINAIYISNFSKNIIENRLNDNIKYYYVENPIDLDFNAKKVDVNNNEYYLFVGRVSKEKGVDCFCETLSNHDLKGIVVGDGDQAYELKTKYPNIEFVGWKNSEEVKQYMKSARCLIFPSRWYEGAPLTPLEAMQYGVPVIVSNKSSAIEYINDKNGLIFDIDKKDDLFDKISEINSNIKDYSNESYNYIKTKKENKYAKNVFEVYEKIMGDNNE